MTVESCVGSSLKFFPEILLAQSVRDLLSQNDHDSLTNPDWLSNFSLPRPLAFIDHVPLIETNHWSFDDFILCLQMRHLMRNRVKKKVLLS